MPQFHWIRPHFYRRCPHGITKQFAQHHRAIPSVLFGFNFCHVQFHGPSSPSAASPIPPYVLWHFPHIYVVPQPSLSSTFFLFSALSLLAFFQFSAMFLLLFLLLCTQPIFSLSLPLLPVSLPLLSLSNTSLSRSIAGS